MNLDKILKKGKTEKEEKIDTKIPRMDLIEYIDSMTIHKRQLDFSQDYISRGYSQYAINKRLSYDNSLFFLAEMLNTVGNLTNEQHYNLLLEMLPKEKFYIKTLKKGKDISYDDKRYISDYYEIGMKDAGIYINSMTEDEIMTILNKYKYGKNKMIEL